MNPELLLQMYDAMPRPQVVVPKAAKADIWRLAVILRYGGIYADSDVKALHPFREYLSPNASVASGIGANKDFHQWCELGGLHSMTRRTSDALRC